LNLQFRDKGIATSMTDNRRSVPHTAGDLGIKPETIVRVPKQASKDGSITARISRADRNVSPGIASVVGVKKLGEDSHGKSEVEGWRDRKRSQMPR